MKSIDQMGRKIYLDGMPKRIVSIVPSQTELLFHLGLKDEVVGLTKFCIHPKEMWKSKPRVGGTKKLHLDRIAALNPDLIIGNKEENERSQIEELEKDFPVWMSDIATIEDAFEMIQSVGKLIGKEKESATLIQTLQGQLNVPHANNNKKPVTAAYLIWRQPWMIAAKGTFIDNMMLAAGFENIFSNKTRYPSITLEELSVANPGVVLLSSEPYPFKEKHFAEIKEHCPEAVVKLVDGELFSWYGSRLLHAAPYFTNLHNDVILSLSKK